MRQNLGTTSLGQIYWFLYESEYCYISLTISGWIFEKAIDSYKPGVPSTPFPNFPVSSSHKNRNCLNIQTSLDILDNRHPRLATSRLANIFGNGTINRAKDFAKVYRHPRK